MLAIVIFIIVAFVRSLLSAYLLLIFKWLHSLILCDAIKWILPVFLLLIREITSQDVIEKG